jgi:hypothetical protein
MDDLNLELASLAQDSAAGARIRESRIPQKRPCAIYTYSVCQGECALIPLSAERLDRFLRFRPPYDEAANYD